MKIGILGGGQLARMLWEASLALKSQIAPSPIFHETRACPAGLAGAEVIEGKIDDLPALSGFFQSVDTFAIENEFLSLPSLKSAWEHAQSQKENSSLSVADVPMPSWLGLEIAQDKFEQKKFFIENKFPTSDFVEVTSEWFQDGAVRLKDLHSQWQGLVLKKARMGYDGKGNWALPPSDSAVFANQDELSRLKGFCQSTFDKHSRVYAEKFVPFQKEVALVSVRSRDGDYGHYPLIETVQKNGVCFLAFKALQSQAIEKQASEIARIVGQKLGLLGTYAIEFFVTDRGELMVNEMAPRVHNSGHFTQSAAKSSQFEMHLKAYTQKTFKPEDFECVNAFAMVNLLGPAGMENPVSKPTVVNAYWYDKERTSPGRKLGHILAQSAREEDLPKLLQELQHSEQRWQESLRIRN